jgi:hypothetical protein
MENFIVLAYEGGRNRIWREVKPIDSDDLYWSGDEPGEVFNKAVIKNRYEDLTTTTYMVLPWDNGGVFDVSIDINTRKNSE